MAKHVLLLSFAFWHMGHGQPWDHAAILDDTNCAAHCTDTTADIKSMLDSSAQTTCGPNEVYDPVSSIVECTTCNSTTVALGYMCEDSAVVLCPMGHYCPSPTEKIPCQEGYWCKTGFVEQVECRPFIKCDAAATNQKAGIGLIVCMILFLGFLCGCSCCITVRNNKSALMMKAAAARLDEVDEVDFSEELKLDIPKLTIEFEGLTMKLKVNGNKVLDNVTGKFPESSLVALMGPSGGGKTTFMNALCGRAQYGNVTGITKINGVHGSVTEFPKTVGFVPQDDIMHADLTVQQNIYYNAKLRLPVGTPEENILNHANQVVKVLGLSHVAQSLVGNPEKRGISGGQKKRVNIGMELAAMPAVVFMDEPTSGLDGAATIQLAQILAKLRKSGLLIVCVIHQPRYAVFAEFSHLLLLGAGGGQVYCGQTMGLEKYFTELGFRCPEKENPADWMIDVTCGLAPRYKSQKGDEIDEIFAAPGDLFKLWDEKYKGKKTPWDGEDKPISKPLSEDRVTPGLCAQTSIFLTREARKWSMTDFLTTVILLFFSGTTLGIIMQTQGTFSYAGILPMLSSPTSLFYMIVTINTRTIYAAERLEFLREFSAGTSATAFWISKTLWSCINWLMFTLGFAVPMYWLMPLPAQPFGLFFAAYLMAGWYHLGLGMLITLSYPSPTASLLYCTFLPIILELAASGGVTTIKDMNKLFKLISVFSCGRWFKTGIFANEMSSFPHHTLDFNDVKKVFDDYEADVDSGSSSFLMLFIVGLLMRLWCWLTLYLLQNSQGTGCMSRIIYLIKKQLYDAGLLARGGPEKVNDVVEDGVTNRVYAKEGKNGLNAAQVGVPPGAHQVQVKPTTQLLGKGADTE